MFGKSVLPIWSLGALSCATAMGFAPTGEARAYEVGASEPSDLSNSLIDSSSLAKFAIALAEKRSLCPQSDGHFRYSTAASAKSSAILGGGSSALERMRLQQSYTAPASDSLVQVADVLLLPQFERDYFGSEPRTDCAAGTVQITAYAPGRTNRRPHEVLEVPRTIKPLAFGPAPRRYETGDGVFLQSPKVRIGSTNLDARWRRVANRGLGTSFVAAQIGRKSSSIDKSTLEAVNAWINRTISKVSDSEFGTADLWSDARTTLRLGRGDCEDFAILKYQALAALGVETSDMFVTIAWDTVRRSDHAILIVRLNGQFVILDDSTDALLDGSLPHDYMPIMSFNSEGKWLHAKPRPEVPAPVTLAYLSLSDVSSTRLMGFNR